MIGGVTRWGGLSDLKGWNSDNLFDWIDFFKRNTYFYFLTKVRTWNKNREFFGNTELFPLTHAHFSWSERGVRGACGKKREDEFWSLLFYTLISFFYWILLEKRFYVVWISFSCAQPILIAWTSCLKLIISTEFIYCGYFCRSNCNHFEWKNAYAYNSERKENWIHLFRTLICITYRSYWEQFVIILPHHEPASPRN